MVYMSSIWPWIVINGITRPPRTTPTSQKDEAYHVQCGRYYLSQQYAPYVQWYRTNYGVNMRYAIDSADAWGEDEDIKMFLGDEKSPTGRVALKFPIIRPMLTRLTGAVDNISINAEAKTATAQFAKTRKEADLAQALLYSQAAQAGPMMAEAMGGNGVTPDEGETERRHDNFYQDSLIRGINSLMSMLSIKSGLESKKRKVAENMALSGVAAAHCSVHGQDLAWEICDPAEVGWDTSALKPDFSDGEYVFTCPLMSVSAIAERWQPQAEKIKALDRWSSTSVLSQGDQQTGWPQRRPRVFTVYWKDMEYVERGFVLKDGEPHFCTINKPDPDRADGKPEYTEKDLIQPPENKWTLKWTAAERRAMKRRTATEVVRYCSFIPWEYLPGPYTQNLPFRRASEIAQDRKDTVGLMGDMVFDWGEYELQESDPDQTFSVNFPIKFSSWSYLSGFVIAPITAAISPQRVMNLTTSDLMWRLSKAGGKSIVMDTRAMAGSSMEQSEILTAQKNGDPYDLDGAPVGGIQNAVIERDTSPGNDIYNMFGLLPTLHGVAQNATGVYDQNFGAPGPQDQLVGTKQLQLQQAGIMQQPFYAAISDLFEQIHQFNAQGGKEWYSRMPWLLAEMTGDTEAQAIEMSKDMQLEQFRVTVKLAPDGEQTKFYVDNTLIPGLMQLQMLDPGTAADLLGKSLPSDVYRAAAEFTRRAQEAAQQQAQADAKQQAMGALLEQKNMLDQQQRDADKEAANVALQTRAQDLKAQAPARQAESEWLKPDVDLAMADMAMQQQQQTTP